MNVFIAELNALPTEHSSGGCFLDLQNDVAFEILYPDGVRVSAPMNLGGCGQRAVPVPAELLDRLGL